MAACPEPLVCDQVEYHPYLDQTKVREACARHGMALVAYSPIARGRIKSDRDAGADRRAPSQDGGAGLPALAGAAGCRGDPAHLEARAAVGEHRDLRFRAVGRRDAADFRDGQRQRPAHRFRFRAEMGLRSARAGRYAADRYVSPTAAIGSHHKYAAYELIHTMIDISSPMTPAFSAKTVAVPGIPTLNCALSIPSGIEITAG